MTTEIDTTPLQVNNRSIQLKTKFTDVFNSQPEFYVRVPGRVNLIGEHIDYSGYGVCPMALQQDILLAVASDNEGTLRLANVDDTYASFDCCIRDVTIEVSDKAPQWHQYFLCGVKGIRELMTSDQRLKGIRVMVSGRIPKSAGLSSSSALVCAAALATAYAHNIKISREEIADVCAKCERHIGTQGGGMDQAIAFLATKGCAKLINFDPLRSTDVRLPPGAVFVIAHSLAELNKAATADYNCRVVECRLAAQIIAKENGLQWQNIQKLGQLQLILKQSLPSMCTMVKNHLHQEVYNKEEIMTLLETTPEELERCSLTSNTTKLDAFKLYQRAMHVYEEALRVELFHAKCTGEGAGDESVAKVLGSLMAASHASLRDLYECSHPQLDRLVELSSGLAFGARLTGAGWGGCVVALLARDNVDAYVNMLKEKFYQGKSDQLLVAEENGDDGFAAILFATEPQSGAAIHLDALAN